MPAPLQRDVIDWLMEGDPAIRWQVQRDLLDRPTRVWEAERRRVATRGWGKQLLDHQDETGTWGGGLYSPKWTSTTYTLLSLRELGLPPRNRAAMQGCRRILDQRVTFEDHAQRGRIAKCAGCTCMGGMFLALPAYFGVNDAKLAALAEYLLTQQMPDGGWNCRLRNGRGAVHGSFHTTFNVLDGVREAIARGIGPKPKLRAAERRAIEFMLMHRLYKSDKTGRVIKEVFTELAFPPRWHYDVLRGLDYIRETPFIRDKRLDDAFELLMQKRLPDGRWPLEREHGGEIFFRMERVGQPSRWNTLRALRSIRARTRRVTRDA
jgi:hypothetical protein